jgi:polyisoprenoid-binding protein YceI
VKNQALLALALVALAACNDPAKDKTKAQTGEAQQASSVSADATKLEIDPATSKIEWTGSKVTAKHEGSFKSFHGTVALAGNDPEKSSVNVEIDTDSLSTEPANLVGHLKSKDFFEVDRFPKATFVSTKIVPGGDKGATHTITGNLELHGVTKSITFPATIAVSKDAVTANAEFAIDRTNWGINYEGMADNLIRKDVVLKLAIKAPRKPGA